MLSLSLAVSAGLLIGSVAATPISSSLQNILKNTHDSPAYEYPTDLTKGIVPVSFALVAVTVVNGGDAKSLGFEDKADIYPCKLLSCRYLYTRISMPISAH